MGNCPGHGKSSSGWEILGLGSLLGDPNSNHRQPAGERLLPTLAVGTEPPVPHSPATTAGTAAGSRSSRGCGPAGEPSAPQLTPAPPLAFPHGELLPTAAVADADAPRALRRPSTAATAHRLAAALRPRTAARTLPAHPRPPSHLPAAPGHRLAWGAGAAGAGAAAATRQAAPLPGAASAAGAAPTHSAPPTRRPPPHCGHAPLPFPLCLAPL